MSKLPLISGRKRIKALKNTGLYVKRQTGSHIILRRDDPFAQVVVPDHKELDRGTLLAIIKHAGLTVEDFVNLLQK
jgi:predicted RNA binding protein YcfA (HicA-like mRNA interferase family)